MGGGPSHSDYNQQAAVAQGQLQIAADETAQQKEDRLRAQALQQPAIDKNTALATGDRTEALKASLPVISKLSAGYESAKQGIMNSIAPGAARDKALSDLEVQRYTTTAGAQAQAVDAAPDKLANIGAGVGSFSLQELGAALSGLQGAGTTTNNIIADKNQSKANSMSIFSSLAGAAGEAAGGGAFGKISDRRVKENLRPILDILSRLVPFQVYQFDYVNGGGEDVGVVAQEIQGIFPELVCSTEKYLRVDYESMGALALSAVAQLKAQVEELRQALAARG